jgi:hypothetical protein
MFYHSSTYFYTAAYITWFHCDHQAWIVYIAAKQVPEAACAIKDNANRLAFVLILLSDWLLHPPEDSCGKIIADNQNVCIDPEQPSVRTCIKGTSHIDNCMASNPHCE